MQGCKTELLNSKCPYCGKNVRSTWVKGSGLLSSPDYVLVADLIFHSACWDKQIAEKPTDSMGDSNATD